MTLPPLWKIYVDIQQKICINFPRRVMMKKRIQKSHFYRDKRIYILKTFILKEIGDDDEGREKNDEQNRGNSTKLA
jgi:hypothetical protein